MREHEVPTHVQAEDKVLLWFTFPQIVAVTAVGALAYGIYSYAPIPSSEVRIGLAVLFALAGIVAIVGKVGGRRLPLVAADLLQYRLGGRTYAGTPAELARSDPPAPMDENPGLIQQMTEKTRHRLRRMRRGGGKRKGRERRNGRKPLRWLRSRRKPRDRGSGGGTHAAMRRVSLIGALMLLALTAVAASDPPTPTPGPGTPYPQTSPDRWRNEIEYDPVEPVPGRRLYVERLSVFEEKATVTLRAAADVELQVQAFGGPEGRELHFYSSAAVDAGESIVYTLPLSGDAPSFTFAWVDATGQAGGVSIDSEQIPHPLPVVEGELCDVRVTEVRWSPGSLTGRVEAGDCIKSVEHPIDLVLVNGEEHIAGPLVMNTRVTGVSGTATVSSGEESTTVRLDPPGSALFRLPAPSGRTLHELGIEATLEAGLRGNAPPLVTLILIPEREETRLVPVKVLRPGTSKTVSETVTVRNEDGTTSSHEISARLTIPSEVITVVPRVLIKYEEYIAATVSPRGSAYGSKEETVELALAIGADAPYAPFVPPPREEEPPPPVQTQLTDDESRGIFDLFGWTWPW